MGGRFINAYVAGVCSTFALFAYLTHNAALFLIEGIIVGFNLMVYFHREDK